MDLPGAGHSVRAQGHGPGVHFLFAGGVEEHDLGFLKAELYGLVDVRGFLHDDRGLVAQKGQDCQDLLFGVREFGVAQRLLFVQDVAAFL